MEDGADLEQGEVHEAARLIAGGGLQEAGQQVGAQVAHFRTDRVVDPHGLGAAAEQGGAGLIDEAVGDAFVVAEGGQRASRSAFARLHRRQDRPWHARFGAAQGLAHQFLQRGDAGHFLDKVRLAQNVGPPGRRGRHVAVQSEAERFKRAALVGLSDLHADKADDAGGVEPVGARGVGHRAVHHEVGRRAAAEVEDHRRGKVQPRKGEGGVHAAFEAIAGVGVDLQRPARGRDGDRVPESGFEEDVGRLGGAAGQLAAHDAGEGFGALVIGNDHHAGGEGVGLAVERQKLLASFRGVDAQGAVDLGGIEHMQRAVEGEGEEVGDIDQRRDRAQADGLEPRGQPVGRGSVGDAPDQAACEERAAFGLERGVDGNGDGAVEGARDDGDRQRLQRAQPPRREVARDPPHAKRIGAVRRDLDVDHRIVQAAKVDKARAQGGVCGQFDDAVMRIRQHEFAFRTEHPVRLDPPDHPGLEVHPRARNMRAGRGEDAHEARPRIRRAADDLNFFRPAPGAVGEGLDPADPQPVGIGVLHRLDHPRDAEGAEFGRRVLDPLHLHPEIGQGGKDRIQRSLGVEVVAQPGEGEFHRGFQIGPVPQGLSRSGRKGEARGPDGADPRGVDGQA